LLEIIALDIAIVYSLGAVGSLREYFPLLVREMILFASPFLESIGCEITFTRLRYSMIGMF